MIVKVNKMADSVNEFKKALLKIDERECKEAVKELETDGRKLLNKTLKNRRPKTGFQAARVSVDRKVTVTKKGCIVKVHFLVTDGSRRTPHRIWHIINRGRQPFVAKDVTRFKSIISPRTLTIEGKRTLEARTFGGYGDWVTIAKGRKYGKIRAREFYKQTASQLKSKTLKRKKFRSLADFNLEVNNG